MTSKVQFQTNIPVEVALAYDEGREVQGNFGPQVMFTLTQAPNGETTMYVPPIVRDRLAELNVAKGQRVSICKAEVKNGNRKMIQWQVARVDPPSQTGRASSPTGGESEEEAAQTATPAGATAQSTTNRNGAGKPRTNGNGHAALPPMQVQFDTAFEEFLVLAGRATHRAESRLSSENVSVRLDNRDTAAIATTMFIEAARRGSLVWTPRAA